jgi:hypothetical protein
MLVAAATFACDARAEGMECHVSAPGISTQFMFSPPEQDGPIEVLFDFELHGINSIDSAEETVELAGVMTVMWNDPRRMFDPAAEGVREKIFQGDHQVNEVASGWYPQVSLLNQAGSYEKSGVQLRIKPDGTVVLKEKLIAAVKTPLDLRAFPFDFHRLEVAFALMGGEKNEAFLRVKPRNLDYGDAIRIPGWSLGRIALSDENLSARIAKVSNAVILAIEVNREAAYIRRLITAPMAVIVLLSFSIFWMDKSSLADRNAVSFTGILTGVSFQSIVVSVIPPVSYITLMQVFLFVSLVLIAATVPINLIVATLDRAGKQGIGDIIDRRCRLIFPLIYLFSLLVMGMIVFT